MAGRTIPRETLGNEAIELFSREEQRIFRADTTRAELAAPHRGADARRRAVAQVLGGLGRGQVRAGAAASAHGDPPVAVSP